LEDRVLLRLRKRSLLDEIVEHGLELVFRLIALRESRGGPGQRAVAARGERLEAREGHPANEGRREGTRGDREGQLVLGHHTHLRNVH